MYIYIVQSCYVVAEKYTDLCFTLNKLHLAHEGPVYNSLSCVYINY